MSITISILNAKGEVLEQASGKESCCLFYQSSYQQGDVIEVQSSCATPFIDLSLDSCLPLSSVYFKNKCFSFPIPQGDKCQTYPPFAFQGSSHRIMARVTENPASRSCFNLALNPYDHGENTTIFPHASANVETRGEAAFAARNAIDGEISSNNHGFWPYTSWGINCDPEAALTLDFGRKVIIEKLIIFTRSDFPHDAWWESAQISLDNGWTKSISLQKTEQGQQIEIEPQIASKLQLDRLVKADDPSPFPALTQLEVWGRDKSPHD